LHIAFLAILRDGAADPLMSSERKACRAVRVPDFSFERFRKKVKNAQLVESGAEMAIAMWLLP